MRMSARAAALRTLPSAMAGLSHLAARPGRQWLIASPPHRGRSWVTRIAPSIPKASTRRSPPLVVNGRTRERRAGATTTDEPARIIISPAEVAVLPPARAVKGGAYGAPGQTARIRNPAAAVGSTWSRRTRRTAPELEFGHFAGWCRGDQP